MAENVKHQFKAIAELSASCEDKNTLYMTFPDGLRIIVNHGEYVGWYVCNEVADNG